MRCAVLLAFLTFVAGCKSNEDPAAPPAPASAATPTTPPVKPAPPPAIGEDRARALLDQWLAAQNRGDFAAYEALYAARFEGVKRVGERVRRFARAGWMADRKRMFGKPMEVEAREPAFATTATTAEVRFVQRWRSGTFEDLGPKRLFLVADGDALKIAREEMLASELVAQPAADDESTGFGFLVDIGSKTFMVLDAPVPDEHGAPRLESVEAGIYTATATVTDAALGDAATRWKKIKIRTDQDCETQLVGFRLMAREVPHFGTVQTWRGQFDSDGNMVDEKDQAQYRTSDEDIAASVFTSGHVAVIAELAACTGLHAQPADRPAPVDGEPLTDPAMEKKARAAFARLPEVVEAQREFENQGGKGSWWPEKLAVALFKHPELRPGAGLGGIRARRGLRRVLRRGLGALRGEERHLASPPHRIAARGDHRHRRHRRRRPPRAPGHRELRHRARPGRRRGQRARRPQVRLQRLPLLSGGPTLAGPRPINHIWYCSLR